MKAQTGIHEMAIMELGRDHCVQDSCAILGGVIRVDALDEPLIDVAALAKLGCLRTCARCRGLVAAAKRVTDARLLECDRLDSQH